MEYEPTSAVLQETIDSVLTKDVDVCPSLIMYQGNGKGLVDVVVSNVSTRTVNVQPRGMLCEIQPVHLQDAEGGDCSPADATNSSFLGDLDIASDSCTLEQRQQLKDLIGRFPDVFSHHENDIGHYVGVEHRIHLTDEVPFKHRHRRIPPGMFDEVREHLKQLAAAGIIRRSHSPWSSGVVLARKKDGKLRMCVDYRALNQRTVKDAYALPRIDEVLDALAGAKYYTVLDMKSGYYQVEVAEEHKDRTAFSVGPLGFYEHNRLPFGLSNAPATYQRLMEDCFGDLNTKICFIYLDDVIIFSDSYEQHIERLELVFLKLRQCGLKLSPKKCSFLKDKVKYVGHIVSSEGIEADPAKIEKVVNWPRPVNAEEVRQFLGFAGYYRRFVANFSAVARPLTDIMPTTAPKKRRSKSSPSPRVWHWGPEQEEAFQSLKDILSSPPVLGFPDFTRPFELHVDACQKGLGAVLCQEQDGRKRVIYYASRGLSKTEQHYPAHKLEFLSLKWAITEKFYDYLYGQKFTVLTDNNPLTYVLTSAKLDATGHRWLAALSSFNFEIKYRPGNGNTDADAMSRHPENTQTISVDSVQAVCHGIQCQPYIETISMSEDVLLNLDTGDFDQMPVSQIRQAQYKDPV